jgi:hypothetical protein
VDQEGRVKEGYLGEQDRLTRVKYAEKELQQDVLDHTTVVTQAEQFMTTQRLTDAMVAGKVECDINEFRRWKESKQSCRLKERAYDEVIQRLMIDFGAYSPNGQTGAGDAGTKGEGTTTAPRRRQRTRKPSGKDQDAKMRALNVGRQLYQMSVDMRVCAELQREGIDGGVTSEAQKELSRRSAAQKQKEKKAGRDRADDTTKEDRMAWSSVMEEFMQGKIGVVKLVMGEHAEDFRERQARTCLPDEKHWGHICCACGEATHSMEDECGECISPQAAAHADAFVRTAFQVERLVSYYRQLDCWGM